jgi:hypothetical protein
MIQRIQTVWLSLCILISLFLLKGSFMEFAGINGLSLAISFKGLVSFSGSAPGVISSSVLIPFTLIAIPVAALVAIILYKDRKAQKIAVYILAFSALLLCFGEGYYWYKAVYGYKTSILPGIKMIIPLLVIVLALLALSGINRDEKLVRSYDRLR